MCSSHNRRAANPQTVVVRSPIFFSAVYLLIPESPVFPHAWHTTTQSHKRFHHQSVTVLRPDSHKTLALSSLLIYSVIPYRRYIEMSSDEGFVRDTI